MNTLRNMFCLLCISYFYIIYIKYKLSNISRLIFLHLHLHNTNTLKKCGLTWFGTGVVKVPLNQLQEHHQVQVWQYKRLYCQIRS
jgi:hypothetical protein